MGESDGAGGRRGHKHTMVTSGSSFGCLRIYHCKPPALAGQTLPVLFFPHVPQWVPPACILCLAWIAIP